ncbi:hypothetical protein DFJ73DRAFT_828352 [Zopfochytrium polystomum]|nr:hypothetical protein DFJ73DRAFT_828352 [Zopfochytrium polystomum]
MRRLKKALATALALKPKKKGKGTIQKKQPAAPVHNRKDKADRKEKRSTSSKKPPQRTLFPGDRILLVGEGNFSFAASLCTLPHLQADTGTATAITATAFDTEEIAREKYPDIDEHLETLTCSDATVLFGIDATKLGTQRVLKGKTFDRIVFNFPHAGAGVKDQDRNIRINQELCLGFFEAAKGMLSDKGTILVTLRSGEPYDSWDVKGLARSAKLSMQSRVPFHPDQYPGYEHRRTLGFDERVSSANNADILRSNCSTYVFWLKERAEEQARPKVKSGKWKKKNNNDSDDDD